MKVIVINDSNGHTNVYAVNQGNLNKLLSYMLDADMLDEPDEAKDLLERDLPPLESELLELLEEEGQINSRGGQIHVLELEETFKTRWNPLT